MPAIGHVTKKTDGSYEGTLKTLTIEAPLTIVVNKDKSDERQPDYRVYSNRVEVGAGWTKIGRLLDPHSLAQPRRPGVRKTRCFSLVLPARTGTLSSRSSGTRGTDKRGA